MDCSSISKIVKEKKFLILSAIILSISLLTVIITCSIPANDGSNVVDDNFTNAPSPFTKLLIVQIGNSDLWALDLDTNNFTYLLKDWKDRIHSFDYYMSKTTYIGSSDAGNPITSSSEQYSELSQPSNWIADKIAVDYIDEKVYVLDVSASNINIFDVEGKHYTVVMSHFQGSKDIALDSVRRLMFVLQSSRIVRANIDGSSREIIVDTVALSSFAIDYHGKVYYADLENINSVSYTGDEHMIVSRISNVVISMAALENKLFWLYTPYESKNAILYSCDIVKESCGGISKISFDGRLLQVKSYNFEKNQIRNPCKAHNRGCEHICITNSTDSSRCVCSIGWQLDRDLKSCKPADDFLLYIESDYIKSQILNDASESFAEAILPFKLNTSFSTECHFDFDVRKRLFIYGNGWNLYKMTFLSESKPVKIEQHKVFQMVIPAIDWISDNLYYVTNETVLEGTEEGLHVWYRSRIKVHPMKTSDTLENDKIILSRDKHENITSLVVHPNKGVLFYTVIQNTNDVKLDEMHLDGSFKSFYGQNLSISNHKNVLGIDCEDDRLYWFNSNISIVHFTHVDDIRVKNFRIEFISNPLRMSIYKDYLYVSTPNSIWRINKISGLNAVKIIPQFQQESQTIFGAKIFSQAVQPINKNHPCAINNGDCQRYCFGIPSQATFRKVCGCAEHESLYPDNRTCYVELA